MFLLLLASIPVTALVFTFGGVGPEDLVRSYVVLFATAICFGSMGLFVSAFVKRTQAATVINLVTTIVVTAGATFLFVFWSSMTANGFLPNQPAQRDDSPISNLTRRPPEALLYFNPFVAQLDVICGTETGFGGTCQIIAAVTDFDSVVNGNIGDQGFGVDQRHVLAAVRRGDAGRGGPARDPVGADGGPDAALADPAPPAEGATGAARVRGDHLMARLPRGRRSGRSVRGRDPRDRPRRPGDARGRPRPGPA